MKPKTNTPAFRIVLTLAGVWVLGATITGFNTVRSIAPANSRVTTDPRIEGCRYRSGDGYAQCFEAAWASIQEEAVADQDSAIIHAAAMTVLPPALALILCAFWEGILSVAKARTGAYVAWVRGDPR